MPREAGCRERPAGVLTSGASAVRALLPLPALPPPVETPSHLRLTDEPAANVNRYDGLGGVDHAS